MKKVFLGVGHGGKDPGAVGYIKEADVNLNMALACRDYLVQNGVEVGMSRTKDEDDTLNEEARECNAFDPDLAVDIHNNAGGGDGFEVYYSVVGGDSKVLAENLEKEILAINQNSRGCKTKVGNGGADYYGFIRMTKAPAVIVEGVFVDNKADAAQADTLEEQKAFGVAYAKGILKTLGITPVDNKPEETPVVPNEEPKEEFESYTVKVTANVLNVRDGASIDAKVVTTVKKGEVYTIIDEDNGWGKLKSGAGWISLKYTTKFDMSNKPAPKPVTKTLKVGSKVKIKQSASRYCTGQNIPNSVKGKTYTVQQIGTSKYPNGVLLKEITSWVNKSDIEIL